MSVLDAIELNSMFHINTGCNKISNCETIAFYDKI